MTTYAHTRYEEGPYLRHSLDSLCSNVEYDTPLIKWPADAYFRLFELDTNLLRRALATSQEPSQQTIAAQVFGNQQKQEYINIAHAASLLYERARIHRQHLRDIDHRLGQIQEMLFCVKINNSPDKTKRQGNLESQLLQLEQQRRDEELAFWKDTVDVRQQFLEGASTYTAAKQRYSVFADVEAEHG
jgi:hypothetical protein